jgi:hypothetical protein
MDPLLLSFATIFIAAGAAWGGARQALNGTRRDVTDIKKGVGKVDDRLRNVEIDVSFLKGQQVNRDITIT